MKKVKFKDLKKITIDLIPKEEYCSNGIRHFKKNFPKGMTINLKNLLAVNYDYFQFWLWKYDNAIWMKWFPETHTKAEERDAIKRLWKKVLKRK